MRRSVICVFFLIGAVLPLRAEQPSRYTESMFRAAMANHSTAPNYVLVTIHDARTDSSRLVCIEAPFLEGALRREHNLENNEAGQRRLLQLVFEPPDRTYSFSKAEALTNVTPRYSPQVLNEVRALFSSRSEAQLRSGSLDSVYAGKHGESCSAYRDAAAHALLERGILCGRGCDVGNLFISHP